MEIRQQCPKCFVHISIITEAFVWRTSGSYNESEFKVEGSCQDRTGLNIHRAEGTPEKCQEGCWEVVEGGGNSGGFSFLLYSTLPSQLISAASHLEKNMGARWSLECPSVTT